MFVKNLFKINGMKAVAESRRKVRDTLISRIQIDILDTDSTISVSAHTVTVLILPFSLS